MMMWMRVQETRMSSEWWQTLAITRATGEWTLVSECECECVRISEVSLYACFNGYLHNQHCSLDHDPRRRDRWRWRWWWCSPSSSTSLQSNGKREVNTFPSVRCLTSAFRQQPKQVFRIRIAVESTAERLRYTLVLGSISRRLVFTLRWLCKRDSTTSRILIETETVRRKKKRTKS